MSFTIRTIMLHLMICIGLECNSASAWSVSLYQTHVRLQATVTFTNRSHASAAHLAALHAPHVLPLLLDAGAPMEARDLNKWSVMHFAAWGGQTTAIQELAARGARQVYIHGPFSQSDLVVRTSRFLLACSNASLCVFICKCSSCIRNRCLPTPRALVLITPYMSHLQRRLVTC
jgi:hypothetical protein